MNPFSYPFRRHPMPAAAAAVSGRRRRSARGLIPAMLLVLAACSAAPLPPGPTGTPPRTGWTLPRARAPMAPGAVTVTPAPAAVPTVARPNAATAPIVIRNDRGGNVVQMMARRADLAASGRPVEIRGACDSACTMLITMPNACLAPDATVGFHAPRLPRTQVIPPIVDQMMAMHYRNGIRARWYNEWRHSLTIKRITAREYVTLDPMTRLCPR